MTDSKEMVLKSILKNLPLIRDKEKLECIVKLGNLELLRLYLKDNKVEVKKKKLNKLLIYTCENNYSLEIIEELLTLGADPQSIFSTNLFRPIISKKILVFILERGLIPMFKRGEIEFYMLHTIFTGRIMHFCNCKDNFWDCGCTDEEREAVEERQYDSFYKSTEPYLSSVSEEECYDIFRDLIYRNNLIELKQALKHGLNPNVKYEGKPILGHLLKLRYSKKQIFLIIDHLDKRQNIDFQGREEVEDYYLDKFSKNIKKAI